MKQKTIDIAVRIVDEDTWREFKAESVMQNMTLGRLLTIAMKEYLKNRKKPA